MTKKLRVLLVEDNEKDVLLVTQWLAASGYELTQRVVQTAEGMRGALCDEEWDLILSDHNLPAFDSLSALGVLNESGLDIPFIIVSGTIGEETAIKVMKAGASDFIGKHHLSRLTTAVGRELRQAGLRKERRMAGDQLQTSERRLREVIDLLPHLIFARDVHGRFILANKAVAEAFGTTVDELTGTMGADVALGTEGGQGDRSYDLEVITTGKQRLIPEDAFVDADGRTRLLATTKIPFTFSGTAVPSVLSVAVDITERRRTEDALKLFRTLMDHSIDMIEVVDCKTAELLDVNEAACVNLGYSRKELLSLTVLDIYPGIDQNAFSHYMHDLRTNGSLVYEGAHQKKDGEEFPVEVNVRHVKLDREYAVAVVRNITERRKVELRLNLLHKAVESSGEIIFMTDNAGVFSFVNPEFSRVYGYCADEVVGKSTPRIIKGGKVPPMEYDVFWKKIMDGQTVTGEFTNRSKDGRLLQVEASVNPIAGEGGKITGFLAVQRDITKRKQDEAALRKSNTDLEETLTRMQQMQNVLVQSEKLASVGQLTAGIAHEINNPLAYISSNINMFEEYFNDVCSLLEGWKALGVRLEATDTVVEDMNILHAREKEVDLAFVKKDFLTLIGHTREGAGRIKNILDKLRGFVHKSGAEDTDAQVNELVDDTLVMVHNELKYSAHIVKEFGDVPFVKCNPGEIEQVLINLLVNAGHAIKESGTITIRTYTEDHLAVIDVEDTGEGIPPENLNRIFDPFFTTKPVGKGTGLGLWLSNSIIVKHNGTLSVHSQCGKGTTFTIRLPLS